MDTVRRDYPEALTAFVLGAQGIINNHFLTAYPKFTPPILSVTFGRRYDKIVSTDVEYQGCRAHCFIDRTNGDVLKAATWKQPAKGPRGNIFDSEGGLARMTPHGTEYNL